MYRLEIEYTISMLPAIYSRISRRLTLNTTPPVGMTALHGSDGSISISICKSISQSGRGISMIRPWLVLCLEYTTAPVVYMLHVCRVLHNPLSPQTHHAASQYHNPTKPISQQLHILKKTENQYLTLAIVLICCSISSSIPFPNPSHCLTLL